MQFLLYDYSKRLYIVILYSFVSLSSALDFGAMHKKEKKKHCIYYIQKVYIHFTINMHTYCIHFYSLFDAFIQSNINCIQGLPLCSFKSVNLFLQQCQTAFEMQLLALMHICNNEIIQQPFTHIHHRSKVVGLVKLYVFKRSLMLKKAAFKKKKSKPVIL